MARFRCSLLHEQQDGSGKDSRSYQDFVRSILHVLDVTNLQPQVELVRTATMLSFQRIEHTSS